MGRDLRVRSRLEGEATGQEFTVKLRIDTPTEAEYFSQGGILRYVARQLAGA